MKQMLEIFTPYSYLRNAGAKCHRHHREPRSSHTLAKCGSQAETPHVFISVEITKLLES